MITIDEEFKNLIPPLSDEEFSQLEENCVREGIRDPLVAWKVSDDTDILIDGHNRWQISASHDGLPFDLKRMTFESRDDAKAWIIRNQIGRRNLNTYNRSLLALELKELIANQAHKRKVEHVQNSAQARTRDELATIAGVSHDTISKVEAIEKSGNDLLKTQARNGDISIHKAYQIATGKVDKSPAKAQKEFLDKVQARHEDFTEKSKEGVVSMSDLKADKEDRKLLANDFYGKCLRMGERITAMWIDIREGDIDLDSLAKDLTAEQKNMLNYEFSKLIRVLTEMKERVIN